jgi:hypothetical protein
MLLSTINCQIQINFDWAFILLGNEKLIMMSHGEMRKKMMGSFIFGVRKRSETCRRPHTPDVVTKSSNNSRNMMQIFLENMVELMVSAPLLNLVWIAAALVISVDVLFFLACVVLAILKSLLDSLNWTIIFAMAGYGVAFALVWKIGVAEDDGVENNGDGGPSRADIETGDIEWTVGEDGCSAGDAIETDAPRSVEDDNGRPVTATEDVPFEPRRSPRIAAQTQTHFEPRRSPRLAANRIRADSLLNFSSQPRRSARIAAVRLMRGV